LNFLGISLPRKNDREATDRQSKQAPRSSTDSWRTILWWYRLMTADRIHSENSIPLGGQAPPPRSRPRKVSAQESSESGSGQEGAGPQGTIDEQCINTIRTLAMDAVQQANSGHPGTPMA